MHSPAQAAAVIKAYDIRGIVPAELNVTIARLVGTAMADAVLTPEGIGKVAIGHDMRQSGPELVQAFAEGLAARGISVVHIGLCSTDELYFAAGHLDCAGAMFTASHNPAKYNGIKLCRPGAKPIGEDTGLGAIREVLESLLGGQDHPAPASAVGEQERVDLLGNYARRLRSLVDVTRIRPLTVVVDAGNGMAGLTVPAVLGTAAGLPSLPLDISEMFFELDGNFPNHEANPLEPANTAALQEAVLDAGADIGLAFDGDADRCFVIDEKGRRVSPSAITALIGAREGARDRRAQRDPVVLYNVITSRAVPEQLGRAGIRTVRTRVGHSYIKDVMAREGAVFGGEHSGHFYFRDFYGADSGMLAALHVLAALGEQDAPLSTLMARYDPYVASGEINSEVDNAAAAQQAVVDALGYAYPGELEIDRLDGVTISHWEQSPKWWLNLRPSNTEPLLRLNVEAEDAQTEAVIREGVLKIVRANGR